MDVSAYTSRGAKVGVRGILNFCSKKSSGFTLIELINSVAVFSIVVSIGVPSLQRFMATNRASTRINDLIATINLARWEAINRNREVTLC